MAHHRQENDYNGQAVVGHNDPALIILQGYDCGNGPHSEIPHFLPAVSQDLGGSAAVQGARDWDFNAQLATESDSTGLELFDLLNQPNSYENLPPYNSHAIEHLFKEPLPPSLTQNSHDKGVGANDLYPTPSTTTFEVQTPLADQPHNLGHPNTSTGQLCTPQSIQSLDDLLPEQLPLFASDIFQFGLAQDNSGQNDEFDHISPDAQHQLYKQMLACNFNQTGLVQGNDALSVVSPELDQSFWGPLSHQSQVSEYSFGQIESVQSQFLGSAINAVAKARPSKRGLDTDSDEPVAATPVSGIDIGRREGQPVPKRRRTQGATQMTIEEKRERNRISSQTHRKRRDDACYISDLISDLKSQIIKLLEQEPRELWRQEIAIKKSEVAKLELLKEKTKPRRRADYTRGQSAEVSTASHEG